MGTHPANLFLRFMLEFMALVSIAIWGWNQAEGWFGLLLAIGLPITLALVWGIFAVPDDPSRSGSAPVPTNGLIRLLIELGFFGFAIWALKDMGWTRTSLVFGIIVLCHYLISYDRILWLLSRSN